MHTFTARRLVSRMVLLGGWLSLCSGSLFAQTAIDDSTRIQGCVIDDHVLSTIGGGRAVSMSPAPDMQPYRVGIGWNSNLMCGDMDLEVTLRNQLNGITDGFQAIMSDVIQSAMWRDKQGEKPATIKMRKPKPLSG